MSGRASWRPRTPQRSTGRACPKHGVHEGADGSEVAQAEGRGGLVILWNDSKLQIRLHQCWSALNICVAKAEPDVLEVRLLVEEDPVI